MENLTYVKIGLFDRIYFTEYEDCNFKYLNWVNNNWLPSDQKIIDSVVVLEKSIAQDDWWVVIKVGDEQR